MLALPDVKRWFARRSPRPHLAEPLPFAQPAAEHSAALDPPPGVAEWHAPTIWRPIRLAVEEELWGAGYLTPGGAPEVLRFALPLGLSTASSLLLLGAGAGGPAQTLATDLGAWTAGFEADPTLAGLAGQRLQRAGVALAKRASVQRWDPHAPAFRAGFHHHALMLEAIRDAVPEQVIAAVAAALKPHGHVVLVETVSPAPLEADDAAVAAWARLEGRAPVLPQPETIARVLGRLGYDIRVEEDISARHMKLAVLGWKALIRRMRGDKPDRIRAGAIVEAAEVWTRRIRLMHDGRIRLMRWHAIHRANAH